MTGQFKMDFIIVGAMKSGTTSLGFHLGRHQGVCIPNGEVHFFENDNNYSRGLDWYELKILKHKTDKTIVCGEKTTAYSYHPSAAKRIHDAFPDVKLVWILREPVARSYSNYIHAIRNGSDSVSFNEAVALETERIKNNIYFGYLERSRYAKQIERFLTLFQREQMHFMLFEEFLGNAKGELKKLFDFIGVSSDEFVLKDEPRGQAVMPRFPKTVYAVRQLAGPGLLSKAVLFANTVFKKPGYIKLDPSFKAELKKSFAEDNARLAELTGLNLEIWK